MRLVGVLPVSAFNLGLALYPQVIASKIEDLVRFAGKMALAIPAQLELGARLPGIAATLPRFTADYMLALASLAKMPMLIMEALATLADPTKWLKANLNLNLSAMLELGLVSRAIDALVVIDGQLELGLRPPSLRLWTYSGSALGMADGAGQVRGSTGRGMNALVIATESPDTWGQLRKSVYTGNTAAGYWRNNGALSAGDLLPGIVRIRAELFRLLLKFRGMKTKLEAQVAFSLGLDLPTLPLEGLALKLGVALDPLNIALDLQNLLTFKLDLTAQIEILQVKIAALLELALDISVQLSAGGLALWSFSGMGEELPGEVSAAVRGGLPGGTGPGAQVFALCVGCEDAEAWGNLGKVLAVA